MSEIDAVSEMTYEDVRTEEIERHREMLRRCEHREGESRVYCILNLERSAVKIGTTRSVKRRFYQLQTASPDKLYLHEHIRGGTEKERELHHRYAGTHLTGEWFSDPDCNIAGEFARFAVEDMLEDLRHRQRGVV